jgi:hypothetical protein
MSKGKIKKKHKNDLNQHKLNHKHTTQAMRTR